MPHICFFYLCVCVCTHVLSHFSRVWLFPTPWSVAHKAPLSMGFSRQEYWSGLPYPSLGDLPNPRINTVSLRFTCLGRRVVYHQRYLRSQSPLLSLRTLNYRYWYKYKYWSRCLLSTSEHLPTHFYVTTSLWLTQVHSGTLRQPTPDYLYITVFVRTHTKIWGKRFPSPPFSLSIYCRKYLIINAFSSLKVKSFSHVWLLVTSRDCSLPGSSVHGIFQARVLEWVAIAFSRGSSWPRDRTQVSHTVGRRFTIWATREVLLFSAMYINPFEC